MIKKIAITVSSLLLLSAPFFSAAAATAVKEKTYTNPKFNYSVKHSALFGVSADNLANVVISAPGSGWVYTVTVLENNKKNLSKLLADEKNKLIVMRREALGNPKAKVVVNTSNTTVGGVAARYFSLKDPADRGNAGAVLIKGSNAFIIYGSDSTAQTKKDFQKFIKSFKFVKPAKAAPAAKLQAPVNVLPKSITPPPTSTPALAPKPATFNIDIKDFKFSSASLTIKRGDTIIWTNSDSAPHQVDSDPHPQHTEHPEINGPFLSQGETFTVTLNNPGTYNYHCHLHPSMRATIIVE